MAAEDELVLPQVPEARPDDPEDVSWALSTAEAMWARGDHSEGIKWVRKAAEAASDAEDDMRALELAKAASELANVVARRSRASVGDPHGLHHAPPEQAQGGYIEQQAPYSSPPPPVSNQPLSYPPPQYAPPPSYSQPPPMSASAPPGPAVRAPIPLPSRSQAPPARGGGAAAPRAPMANNSAARSPGPAPVNRGVSPNRTAEAKSGKARRRSRENLDAEAQVAGVMDTQKHTALDGEVLTRAMREDPEVTAAIEVPATNARLRRRSRPEEHETIVARLEDLDRPRSAEEWDASPTENLVGDDNPLDAHDRATALVQMPAPVPVAAPAPAPPAPVARPQAARPANANAKAGSVRPPSATVHDPEIQTSQAVRVIVWRDANGVHLAPAGTVVSSITIDAVLVVLEPGVDLTAWLSQRDR